MWAWLRTDFIFRLWWFGFYLIRAHIKSKQEMTHNPTAKIAPVDILKQNTHSVRHSNRAGLKIESTRHRPPPPPPPKTHNHNMFSIFLPKRRHALCICPHISLCVCACICVNVYASVCGYVLCIYVCKCAYVYVCICALVYIYGRTSARICVYKCTYICVHMHVCFVFMCYVIVRVTKAEAARSLKT